LVTKLISLPNTNNLILAWYINFHYGCVYFTDKIVVPHIVRCVRNAQKREA